MVKIASPKKHTTKKQISPKKDDEIAKDIVISPSKAAKKETKKALSPKNQNKTDKDKSTSIESEVNQDNKQLTKKSLSSKKQPKKKQDKDQEKSASAEPPAKKKKTPPISRSESVTERAPTTRVDFIPEKHFKVISWNVDGIRANGRLDDLISIVTNEDPDLICLQETKLQAPWEADWSSKLAGYDAVWSCCSAKKGYSGTSIFYRSAHGPPAVFGEGVEVSTSSGSSSSSSKKKMTKISNFFAPKKGPSPKTEEKAPEPSNPNEAKIKAISFGINAPELDNEGRSITVEYDDVIFVNLYVPNSGQKLERLKYRLEEWNVALEKYVATLEEERKKSVIVLGDLNVAHRDNDVYNSYAPHIKKQAGCTFEERAAFTAWLDAGYVDAFRFIHGDVTGAYTYWNTRMNNRVDNKGLRLDYFIVSQALTQSPSRVIDSFVLHEATKSSDHAPVGLLLAK